MPLASLDLVPSTCILIYDELSNWTDLACSGRLRHSLQVEFDIEVVRVVEGAI